MGPATFTLFPFWVSHAALAAGCATPPPPVCQLSPCHGDSVSRGQTPARTPSPPVSLIDGGDVGGGQLSPGKAGTASLPAHGRAPSDTDQRPTAANPMPCGVGLPLPASPHRYVRVALGSPPVSRRCLWYNRTAYPFVLEPHTPGLPVHWGAGCLPRRWSGLPTPPPPSLAWGL